MFSYWFMTAFSIIRMYWQVDSVTSCLANSGDGVWHTRMLMDLWSAVSVLPFIMSSTEVECCGPSAYNSTLAPPLAIWATLSSPLFPWLEKEVEESTFTTWGQDVADNLRAGPQWPTSWCSNVAHSGAAQRGPGDCPQPQSELGIQSSLVAPWDDIAPANTFTAAQWDVEQRTQTRCAKISDPQEQWWMSTGCFKLLSLRVICYTAGDN